MSKPIFRLTLEEARAELLRAIPGTWRQEMLRARIGQLKRKEAEPEQLALQTPAAPAAPVAPVMPAAPTAALVTPTAPTAEPDYTHEQLSSAAAAYLDKDAANMSKLQMLLGQLGVQAVTQLNTPVLRTAFANALRGLGAQL